MKRRDALKTIAVASLAVGTMAEAYDEKLLTNKKVMSVKDPKKPTDFELKHLPDIKIGDKDAKGFTIVEVGIGQGGIIHPSTDKHWIYEIELFADGKKVALLSLEPAISRGYLAARVNLDKVKELKAVSSCNLHGIWTATKKL